MWENLGLVGIPFLTSSISQGKQQHRLWSLFPLKHDGNTYAIHVSDDYGESWVVWHIPSLAPEFEVGSPEPVVFVDQVGNVYFTAAQFKDGNGNLLPEASCWLYVVEPVPEAGRAAIRCLQLKTADPVLNQNRRGPSVPRIRPWAYSTGGDDRHVYVGQYGLCPPSAGGGNGFVPAGYLWLGTPTPSQPSVKFTDHTPYQFRQTAPISQEPKVKHLHAVKYDPWGNSVYLTTGDTLRELWVSDTELSNFVLFRQGGNFGYTTITFTTQFILFGDDGSSLNNVWVHDRTKPLYHNGPSPAPGDYKVFNTGVTGQIFGLVTYTETEVWALSDAGAAYDAIAHQLIYNGTRWDHIAAVHLPPGEYAQYMVADGNGQANDCPWVFVTAPYNIDLDNKDGIDGRRWRVWRLSRTQRQPSVAT